MTGSVAAGENALSRHSDKARHSAFEFATIPLSRNISTDAGPNLQVVRNDCQHLRGDPYERDPNQSFPN
jgi:hypothetical protein